MQSARTRTVKCRSANEVWTAVVGGATHVVAVYTPYAKYTDEDVRSICAAVAISKTLRVLDISWFNQRREVCADLLYGVELNESIVCLGMTGCRVNDDDALTLARILKRRTPPIASLLLSWNDITDVGAAALAEAIRESRTLTHLGLANNRVTDAGAAVLARAWLRAPALESLKVHGAPCSPRAASLVKRGGATRVAVIATLALLGKPTNARGRALREFLNADGDHAAWSRVTVFLSGI